MKTAEKPIASNLEIRNSIVNILRFVGENPERDGLLETPDRMMKSWGELLGGYKENPADLFKMFESDGYDEMIILKDIEFYSICEHHFLGFGGKAHVAYIPSNKIIGISKLARLVDIFSRRLQIQERLTLQIAETLMEHLSPLGAGVVMEGGHSCMGCRGIKKPDAKMVTSALKGAFSKPEVRQEFFKLIGR